LCNDKRDDSFAFNYTLPEYICNNQHIKKFHHGDYPLVGSGFVGNICKTFFKRNIQGIAMVLKCIIANFDKQDTDIDYKANNYKTVSKTKIVKDWNVESFRDKTQPTQIDVEKVFTTESMTIHNHKSGYVGKCVLESEDGELKKILIYGVSSNQDLQVKIRYCALDEDGDQEEPEIEHFKYIADINSFFMMIEQIMYGIQDTIKKQTKKQ
jgi:hypothetical protein